MDDLVHRGEVGQRSRSTFLRSKGQLIVIDIYDDVLLYIFCY